MRKRNTTLLVLLLLAGAGIFLYPAVSNFVNHLNGSYAIAQMQRQLVDADIAQQRQLARSYNARLTEGEPEGYEEILDLANGIMGSILIPKIDVNLPIYHGTDEDVLTKGVGHLPSSAFPIGGEGNHAVLTGHTGLPSAKLFTDLTELEEGDTFYIHILEETLAYQVDQIKVVLPSEGQDLTAVPGEDYCTLVTCTPYGVNSHRLLVRGHRVEAAEEVLVMLQDEAPTEGRTWILPAVTAGCILVLAMCIAAVRRRRRKT